MPKKQPKNAFFYYMLDVKRREEQCGQRFPGGLAQVSTLASAQWTKMAPHERSQYEKRAKWASNSTGADGELYTSQGIAYSTVERARNAQLNAEATMKTEIDDMVQSSYQNNTIADQPYHFIAVNYFCRTLTDQRYYPAELALLRYTLADGYTRRLHTFINPGQLPAGYAFEALEHSNKVHSIVPPPRAQGQSDYALIMRDLIAFIGSEDAGGGVDAESGGSRRLPPLFTDVRQLAAVRSIVGQLCRAAGREPSTVRVYPLVQLFYVLKREVLRYGLDETEAAFKSEHVAQAMLDRDRYDMRDEIACQFHQNQDRSKHCALSVVTRYAFMLSDHCCMDLGIELVLGKHVPADSDVAAAHQHKTEMDAVRAMSKSAIIHASFADADEEDDRIDKTEAFAGPGFDGYIDAKDDENNHSGADSENENTKYDDCRGVDAGISTNASSVNYTQYLSDTTVDSKLLNGSDNPFLRRAWPKPRAPSDMSFGTAALTDSVLEHKSKVGWGRGRLA